MEIQQEKTNTKHCPMVSVIMPAYNSEQFIEKSIRSALGQTYSNLEVIVIDDCSKDRTVQIVQKLAQEDNRVRLIQNETNAGAANSRNKGMDCSRGAYVALLDSDDIWHPDKLQKQIKLAEETGAGLIYCSYAMVDEQGKKKCRDFVVNERISLNSMLRKNDIGCSTVLMRADVIQQRRFSNAYYHEDYVLWLQLLKEGVQAVGIREVLVDYTLRDNSRAANKVNAAKRRWEIYRSFMGFSVIRSGFYLMQYAVSGVLKYAQTRQKHES